MLGGEIPPENLAALADFTARGGRFALATGRPAQSARRYARAAGVNCPCIVYNGAALYDFEREQILWETFLPEGAKALAEPILRRFPELGTEVYCGPELYVLRPSPETEWHLAYEGLESRAAPLEGVLPLPWTKVLFAGPPERIEEVMRFSEDLPQEDCYFLRTAPQLFELTARSADKGAALLRLAELLGVERANTCAVGDYYNDRSMVRAAGIGAFVAEAPEELKRLAEYRACAAKDGGVADFVRYLMRLADPAPAGGSL